MESGEFPMQGSPPFDGDVEESHELRYTLNSTTTGSPHTDLVSTPDQPSHDTTDVTSAEDGAAVRSDNVGGIERACE